MSEGILIALIGFAGVIVSNIITSSNNSKKLVNEIKTENNKVVGEIKLELATYKATTDEQIKELTREVREHNNFAKRMPVVEEGIENLKEKVNYFHKV
jgi:hypothetical protein